MMTKCNSARRLLLGSLAICSLMFLLSTAGLAQIEQAGVVYGDYKVQQSVEIGERYTSVSGNEPVYNTMENLHKGPRLLDQNMYMRSLKHDGNAFTDELYFNSFGLGGDPNAGARLRMNKNRWYDLKADFRTDKNWWDFNTLDQPYNAAGWPLKWTSNSLHAMYMRRNMGSFDATIAPQSRVSLRFGYSGNSNSGPSYTTIHQIGDYQLMQTGTTRSNEWRAGVDVQLAKRTFLKYDQSFTRDRDDLQWLANNIATYNVNTAVSGGTPIPGTGQLDVGYLYDPNYGFPCSGVLSGGAIQVGKCSSPYGGLMSGYYRQQPTHTNIPTEQLSFTSSYWERLDITATASYSDAHSTVHDFNDLASAYYAVTGIKATRLDGPVNVHQRTASADLGATYHVSDTLSVSDQFRFLHWRIPANAALTTSTCFPSAAVGSPNDFVTAGIGSGDNSSSCGGLTANGAAFAGSSTTPDVSTDAVYRFLGERSVYNTASVSWDPSLKLALHVGYRFGDRQLDSQTMDMVTATTYADNTTTRVAGTSQTLSPLTPRSDSLQEHALLLGSDIRPTSKWRVHMNYDMTYADNNFVPTAPKEQHSFKLRTTYSFDRYGKLAATLNLKDNRNDSVSSYLGQSDFPTGVSSPKHNDYLRTYGLSYAAQPVRWASVDMGWTYEDMYSNSGTCLPLTAGVVPAGSTLSLAAPNGYVGCVISGSTVTNEMPTVLKYRQLTNTGYFKVRWKPSRTLTILAGYDLSSGQGYQLWERADNGQAVQVPVDSTLLNVVTSTSITPAAYFTGLTPRVPLGTLNTIWQRPMAGVEYAVSRQVTFRGIYNNYQYRDKSPAGTIVLPRDFHANAGTLSVKYSF